MRRIYLIFPLIFAGCTTGISMDSVDYYSLFNDSNSKVWLVNKVIIENADIAPVTNTDKDIMVFHVNGNCDYIALKDVTRKSPRKGYYYLNSNERTMVIDFRNKESWDLKLSYLTEDSVLMEPTRNSDIQIAVQLIPFPEL